MILNALFPVLALILCGAALKRFGLTDPHFMKTCDRLVYYIAFPAMLFWKIGGDPLQPGMDWQYCLAGALAVISGFGISLAIIHWGGISDFKAGSFSQSCYRFNTYIGMAVVINAFGEAGARLFGILVGLLIPFINVMAVSSLIWFGQKAVRPQGQLRRIIKNIGLNPLILGCLAGLIYAAGIGHFPDFIDNSLQLLSSLTLPLALISIGGSLRFGGIRAHLKLTLLAAFVKLAVLPLMGLFWLGVFNVTGLAHQVTLLFLSLPTATAMYVLSAQLNSDTRLASVSILCSTLLSFVSMGILLSG